MSRNEGTPAPRPRLGPIASGLVEGHPQPGTALENHLEKLMDDRNALSEVKAMNKLLMTRDEQQCRVITELVGAVYAIAESVTGLTKMVDHRTRHMSDVFLNVSAHVGRSNTTEGEDRERYHLRFEELFKEGARNLELLSKDVVEMARTGPEMNKRAMATIEEQSLSIPHAGDLGLSKIHGVRGHER